MGTILYDESTIAAAKVNIERSNTAIIDAVGKIYLELITMNETLNTPRSSKAILEYRNYLDTKLDYLKNKKESYNHTFNLISGGYHNYSDNVGRTVGDTSGN